MSRLETLNVDFASILPAGSAIEDQCRERLRAGDTERVLTTLMNAYGRDLHRYCWGMLRHKEMAEDTLQTVFVQAHEALVTQQTPTGFRSWLFAIARHRCLDELRRRRRWDRLVDDRKTDVEIAGSAAESGEPELDSRTLNAQLQQCLGALSDQSRELVLLRFRQDLSYDEIAAAAGSNVGALRVRVCRVLTALRRCLEKKGASL